MFSKPGRSLIGFTSLSHFTQLFPSLLNPVTILRPVIFISLLPFESVRPEGLRASVRRYRSFVSATRESTAADRTEKPRSLIPVGISPCREPSDLCRPAGTELATAAGMIPDHRCQICASEMLGTPSPESPPICLLCRLSAEEAVSTA